MCNGKAQWSVVTKTAAGVFKAGFGLTKVVSTTESARHPKNAEQGIAQIRLYVPSMMCIKMLNTNKRSDPQ